MTEGTSICTLLTGQANTVLFGSSLIIKPGPPFVNWLSQCYLSLDHTIALKNSTIGKIEN